jgi:hypothetical protein
MKTTIKKLTHKLPRIKGYSQLFLFCIGVFALTRGYIYSPAAVINPQTEANLIVIIEFLNLGLGFWCVLWYLTGTIAIIFSFLKRNTIAYMLSIFTCGIWGFAYLNTWISSLVNGEYNTAFSGAGTVLVLTACICIGYLGLPRTWKNGSKV